MIMQQGCWQRVLGRCLLAICLLGASGCIGFLHPVQPTLPELAQACQEIPKCCRDHVYVFIIHGMDPLDYANLGGVRDYLHQLGFNKTYYGQLYHTSYFCKQVRRIHAEEPEAHFVLIGFSFGANMVRNVAQNVKNDGIDIELLLYLGGNTLENTPRDRPENAIRVVNVLAHGYIWNGTQFDDGENINVEDVWHFGSPTHPRTLEALARNLVEIASSIPIVEPIPSEPKMDPNTEPTPRPVMPRAEDALRGWDFLTPVSQLHLAPTESRESGPGEKTTVLRTPTIRPTLAEIASKN
jgi:hypothetical protein